MSTVKQPEHWQLFQMSKLYSNCVSGKCARVFIVSTEGKKIEDNNRIRSSVAEPLKEVKSGLTLS